MQGKVLIGLSIHLSLGKMVSKHSLYGVHATMCSIIEGCKSSRYQQLKDLRKAGKVGCGYLH